jgi:hypothetical protein
MVVKHTHLKVQSDRGWLRTTLAPLNERSESGFGAKDFVMFVFVVSVVVVLARVCIAH